MENNENNTAEDQVNTTEPTAEENLQTKLTEMREEFKEQMEQQQAAMDALKQNNQNLLDEKKAVHEKVVTARTTQLESEGEWQKLREEERQIAKDREAALQEKVNDSSLQVSELNKRFNGITSDAVIKASLDKYGVELNRGMVESHFRYGLEHDAQGQPLFKGQPLADAIKDWSSTDAAKIHLVSNNSGSGAKPSTNSSSFDSNKSVKDMSEAEMLKAAENGAFDKGKTWY